MCEGDELGFSVGGSIGCKAGNGSVVCTDEMDVAFDTILVSAGAKFAKFAFVSALTAASKFS